MTRKAAPAPDRSRRGPRGRAEPAEPVPPASPALTRVFPDPRGPYLIPLVLLYVARIIAWVQLPLASEDAYITYRYARNLASGNGLVYNPGEKVMGFSSPVWTIWNALGLRLVHDPVLWSRLTSLGADMVTLLCVGRLLERHAGRASAWCFTFFFAAWPFFSAVSVSGMENNLMLALLALGAWLVERGSRGAGSVLGLLALTRPEGVVSAAILALGARTRDRITAAVILLVGTASLTLYFGSPLPQSVMAKSQLYGTPGPWEGRFWWDWLLPLWLGRWPSAGELNMLVPLTVVWAATLAPGLALLWRVRRSALALAAAAALAVWLGYVLLGVAYFYWYLTVPLAGLTIVAAAGLPRVVRGRALYVAIVLCVLGTWTIARLLYLGRAQAESASFARVAETLQQNSRPGETVMLEPIGMVGFLNPVRVIDEVGLVSPGVAARRLRGPGWYADIALERRPEWLVVRRGVLERGRAFAGRGAPFRDEAERDSLLARYRELPGQESETGDQALVVYRRR